MRDRVQVRARVRLRAESPAAWAESAEPPPVGAVWTAAAVRFRMAAVRARAFWKAVTVDESDLLGRLLALLGERGVAFCLIGGQAVNAYVDPVVSLDLDLVIAPRDVETVAQLAKGRFEIERFPHSVNLSAPGSDLRVPIQTDPRYAVFVDRATVRNVLGYELPVAAVEDVLQGKIWAAEDPSRRASKRLKDLADIARLVEAHPALRERVPKAIRDRLY